ncbi:MAG: glycosyltransferase [Chitinophagaceae bacterium]|nr:glycosyltransferase [Chitinophagaceae bacterium]
MDDACRKSHHEYYNLNFDDSSIIPLPMIINKKPLSDNYEKNKIVSVGRITAFKPYPFGVVKAIKKLNDTTGLKLTYHIIGEGHEYDKLKKLVANLKMQKNVIFYGTIPYSEINNIIKDAYCFIGMGTTVGEAAGIGLPSLVAIIDEENDSYDLLGRLPNNILGEPGEDLRTIPYEESLYNLCNLTPEAYQRERELSLKKAAYYAVENVAELFIKAFKKGADDTLKFSTLDLLLFEATRIQLKFFLKKGYRHK